MNLLAVHPNYELYGSDRAFAAALGAIRRHWPAGAVTVLVPRTGPLLGLPIFRDVRVSIERFWIARRRDLKARRLPAFLANGTWYLWRARHRMRAFDVVYIDTIVCLDHILATRTTGVPTLIHVHELPLGMEMRVFRWMLIASGATVAFNSRATRDAFALPAQVRQTIVYNGTPVPARMTLSDYTGERRLRLLQIGRISFWKGQEILIDALANLPERLRQRVELRIVGDVFEDQTALRDKLCRQIAAAGLADIVAFEPFVDYPEAIYRHADIIIVPSTRPEPFGRVAIEAMAQGRGVIASAHGGLVESVEDEVTGRLFRPSDAAALAGIITDYLDDPTAVQRHGAAGFDRFCRLFTDVAAAEQIVAALEMAMAP